VNAWLSLDQKERRLACEKTAVELGISAVSVEKDFWVCWVLRELLSLPGWGEQLTLKGGTSLSKAWKLIDRFSEDIDLVIERAHLGFAGPTLSGSRVEKLKEVCSARIDAGIRPALLQRIGKALPKGADWSLRLAGRDEDRDQLTLLFAYPSVLPIETDYIKREVRMEFGARSETEPAERPTIQPFLSEHIPGIFSSAGFIVKTIAARRTFWEKAMLLHEECYRPIEKPLKKRLSRHYYDIFCLIEKGTAAEAIKDALLFDRIAKHRQAFFRQKWLDYSTLKKGTLRMAPPKARLAEWRRDYQAMRGDMFFSEPPAFAQVLAAVGKFEADFNNA
jgi:hypothetical protein